MSDARVRTSIAPWLAVRDGAEALAFYRNAFGATELYRLDGVDGQIVVAQLEVDGAAFWLQEDGENVPELGLPKSVRMILTVDDPDAMFARAVAAGATEATAVHEEHGWRAGRIVDPFGHDWELSKPVGS